MKAASGRKTGKLVFYLCYAVSAREAADNIGNHYDKAHEIKYPVDMRAVAIGKQRPDDERREIREAEASQRGESFFQVMDIFSRATKRVLDRRNRPYNE